MSMPDAPVPSMGPVEERGSAKLRRQLGLLRTLTVIGLVLVVIVGVWSVVGIVALTSQMSSLQGKVDSLSARLAEERSSTGAAAAPESPTPQASPEVAATPPADLVVPDGADKAGAIIVGEPDAAQVVEVYVDYQCPYCQRWETELGAPLMERALTPGSGIVVRQYNMAFLGEANRALNPPGASARAANAAACVRDMDGSEAFVAFNAAIFAAPGGTDPATRFDSASFLALAGGAGASDAALACIDDGRFMPFVAATTQGAFARGVTGTPTVLVNGKVVADSFNDAQLLSLLRM